MNLNYTFLFKLQKCDDSCLLSCPRDYRVSESPFYPELTVKSIHLAAGAIHYGKLKTFLLLQSQVLVIENLKAVLSCVIPGTCITNSNNLDIINWCKVS